MMNGHTLAGYTYICMRGGALERILALFVNIGYSMDQTHTHLVVVEHFMFLCESRAFTHSHNRTHLTMATTRHIHLKSSLTHTHKHLLPRCCETGRVCLYVLCLAHKHVFISFPFARRAPWQLVLFKTNSSCIHTILWGCSKTHEWICISLGRCVPVPAYIIYIQSWAPKYGTKIVSLL